MIKVQKELLISQVKELIKRVITHRIKCSKWDKLKYCYDCHKGKLTSIERSLKELQQEINLTC